MFAFSYGAGEGYHNAESSDDRKGGKTSLPRGRVRAAGDTLDPKAKAMCSIHVFEERDKLKPSWTSLNINAVSGFTRIVGLNRRQLLVGTTIIRSR